MPSVARKKSKPVPTVEGLIRFIREHKVMLDRDLAELYGVETRALNQAVRRNLSRFPPDFMFQLSAKEEDSLRSQFVISNKNSLRSQIVTSNKGRGGRRYLPYAFTEHGIVMLSSVLNSERAAQMNIIVVRAFVRLREMIAANKDLAARIEKIERRQEKTSSVIEILAEDIGRLAEDIHWIKNPPLPKKYRIGFHTGGNSER